MKNLTYTGPSHTRGFSQEDLKSAGVDHKDIEFERGVSLEVSNELADAITNQAHIFGQGFVITEDEVKTETEEKPAKGEAAASSVPARAKTTSGTTGS